MARGWESKNVESQMEDQARQSPGRRDDERARDDIERDHRKRSLEMTRRSVARDLESSRSPVHRTALEHALRHLDDEMKKLGG